MTKTQTKDTPSKTNSQALYRKYRPQKFAEVVGQEQVVTALEGAIAKRNFTHAYLFAGGRGTGKTSVARIFARALGTSESDIYEIDAASNRGIDDVRELREGVAVLPLNSQYKIYIIDEVHMLTKEAFNALLKTLEEPPQHVIFILATTEMERLPATIVSRCQSLLFKKPSPSMLAKVVERIAKDEGHVIEPAGAELIALIGDGSFRDTLGTLQKVIAQLGGAAKVITYENVAEATGAPSSELIEAVIKAIAVAGNTGSSPEQTQVDIQAGLKAIETARERNIDPKIFLDMIVARARALIIAKIRGEAVTITLNSNHLLSLLQAYSNLGTTGSPMLGLELVIIKSAEVTKLG